MKRKIVSFEILRIFAMLLILLAHCISHGKVLENVQFHSLNQGIVLFLRVLVMTSVNCYVLITGYFMIYKIFNIQKIFQIWIKVISYSLLFVVIFTIPNFNIKYSVINIIESLFPVFTKLYWFATIYIALCFLSPFLNRLILQMTKKQLQILIGILGFYFCICANILPVSRMISPVKGNDIIWFICLYVLAAYFRLYYKPNTISSSKLLRYFGVLICLETLIVVGIFWSPLHKNLIDLISNHNSIMNVMASICLFLVALNNSKKEIKNSNVIFRIANSTFGIYLIHDNVWVRKWLWKIIRPSRFVGSNYLLVILVVIVIILFTVCSVLDMFYSSVISKIGKRISGRINFYKWSKKLKRFNKIINEGIAENES